MSEHVVGIQLRSESLDARDASTVLRELSENGGVNTVLLAAQSFGPDARLRDPRNGYAATPHPQYYAQTRLGAPQPQRVDFLAQVLEAAAEQGLQVYSWLCEDQSADTARSVPGWLNILQVDVFGRRGPLPCLRQPDYRHWWLGITEDQVKSYAIDGLYFSSHRVSPLSEVLACGLGRGGARRAAPGCFCDICTTQAALLGIDAERAREGLTQLLRLEDMIGSNPAGENLLVVAFRVLLRYPEVMAWEHFWMGGYLGLQSQVYGTVKAIAPDLPFGSEVSQQASQSPLYRALTDHRDLPRSADFLSLSLRRDRQEPARLANLSAPTSTRFLADVLGYDEGLEGEFAHLIASEVRRVLATSDRRHPIYVSVGAGDVVSDIKAAAAAGSSGVILPTEFSQQPGCDDLRAAGAATREIGVMQQ